ncbi:MAG: branched-chain amino acid ABC transporter permease [Beijerinckiaceae bacterium]
MISYLVFILVVAGIYALLAQSLTLSWGLTGMVNLGLVGFFAIGAYASAMATKWGGLPIPLGLIAAIVLGLLSGFIVTVSTLRLHDDYLAIVTLGFAELVRLVASNEIWLTGGTDGIAGVPSIVPRSWGPNYHLTMLAIISITVLIVHLGLNHLARSPWGRVLRAIREDQTVAAVAGKPVVWFKAQAFSIAAAIAALAGGLYGHYTSFVAPDVYQPLITIYVFLAVTAGGVGRPLGAVVGAYLLVIFLEATRFFAEVIPGVTPVQAASIREILVGLALILILRWKPQGILPELNQKAPVRSAL